MSRQSRRSRYSKTRTQKQKGGGMFDSFSQKATELTNNAIQKSKDMGLHNKAAAAHQAAIGHATTAKKMVSDLSNHAMTKSMEIHGMMKPHLDSAASHANDALMHAQNKNVKSFNASMGNFASGMGKAGAAGTDHITKNTKVGDASLAQHASAMGNKVKDLHSNAMSYLGFGSKPKPAPAAPTSAVGGRRRKSRKHQMKSKRSRTMKARKTKNAKSMKRRSRRAHKSKSKQR